MYRTIVILLVLLAGAQNTALACGACCFMQAEAAECPHEADSLSRQVASLDDTCSNHASFLAIDPETGRASTQDGYDVDAHPVNRRGPDSPLTHFAPRPQLAPPHPSPRLTNLRI